MVLEYLLMGHHLIPGVSGMSGTLCKLLGRGGPPGAPAGRAFGFIEPCSVLLPPTLFVWFGPKALRFAPENASVGHR